jgi:hypothetical protein
VRWLALAVVACAVAGCIQAPYTPMPAPPPSALASDDAFARPGCVDTVCPAALFPGLPMEGIHRPAQALAVSGGVIPSWMAVGERYLAWTPTEDVYVDSAASYSRVFGGVYFLDRGTGAVSHMAADGIVMALCTTGVRFYVDVGVPPVSDGSQPFASRGERLLAYHIEEWDPSHGARRAIRTTLPGSVTLLSCDGDEALVLNAADGSQRWANVSADDRPALVRLDTGGARQLGIPPPGFEGATIGSVGAFVAGGSLYWEQHDAGAASSRVFVQDLATGDRVEQPCGGWRLDMFAAWPHGCASSAGVEVRYTTRDGATEAIGFEGRSVEIWMDRDHPLVLMQEWLSDSSWDSRLWAWRPGEPAVLLAEGLLSRAWDWADDKTLFLWRAASADGTFVLYAMDLAPLMS